MPTTLATIRDQMTALLEAVTPAHLAAQTYRRHRDAEPFAAWVEAHAEGCLRRFEITSELDFAEAPPSDGLIERSTATMTLRVAYPLSMGLYGAENERDAEDLIDADFAQIDEALGKHGAPDYVTEHHETAFRSLALEPAGAARIVAISYPVQFNRSV
jgi:hypothetical protein